MINHTVMASSKSPDEIPDRMQKNDFKYIQKDERRK